MTTNVTHLTTVDRDGMANFLIRTRSNALVFPINLATPEGFVPVLSLVQRISSSLIPPAHISSQSSTVTAGSNHFQTGLNSCANNGFLLPFRGRKPYSPSTAWKLFTNLHYKGRQTSLTTTTRYSDEPTMPTFTIQL
jgi:hypothetical protein